MLKVSPWKDVIWFEKCRKLKSRYVGPFKILARVSPVAYRLELPPELSSEYNTFHSRIPIVKVRWNFQRGPEKGRRQEEGDGVRGH